MVKLIDITGKAISGEWGSDDENGTGIPVLRTTNFTNHGVVNYNNVVTRCIEKKNIEHKYLQSGDIIIEKSGGSDTQPVGRVIYFEGKENTYLFNNFTGLLRVKDKSKWNPKYVFYALYANYRMGGTRAFENKTTGLHNLKVDAYVNKFEIKQIEFLEQSRIVDILDRIRNIINQRQHQLAQLDLLVKARFVEMFGDPIENEKHWKTQMLNELCDGIGDGLHGTPEYDDAGDYPFINGNNLVDGKISITDSTKFISHSQYEKIFINISPNAILISINGTLGKLAFYKGEKVALGKSVCYCNIKNEINNVFIYSLMKSDSFAKFLDKSSTKSTIKNVGLKAMREFMVIVPPIGLQNEFSIFVSQINKAKFVVHFQIAQMGNKGTIFTES